MTNNFEERMSKRTDAELLKIITGPLDAYQPAALDAAKNEFARRNLSEVQLQTAKDEVERAQKVKDAKANEPLDGGYKILTFIFPGMLLFIISEKLKSDGYDRKGKELSRWTLYGFGFYFVIIYLLI